MGASMSGPKNDKVKITKVFKLPLNMVWRTLLSRRTTDDGLVEWDEMLVDNIIDDLKAMGLLREERIDFSKVELDG